MVHWSRQQIISSCCRGQHTSKQGNSGQDRPPGRLMTWDHQGLSIGKNRTEAFDKPNFLIRLDLAFKPDLQIYSYHLLRTCQDLQKDWVTRLFILSSVEMPPPALCYCTSHPQFEVKLKATSLVEISWPVPKLADRSCQFPIVFYLNALPSLVHRLDPFSYCLTCLTLVSLTII